MSTTVQISGKPVAVGTANAFGPMAVAFKAATGCELLVTDGIRSLANQQKAWDDYQAGRGPRAAYPNPQAPHIRGVALDLRDSGGDPGVTRAGTPRSNWLRANAPRFGFQPVGFGYGEPWHYEFSGDPWKDNTPTPAPAPAQGDGAVAGVHGPNPFGIPFTGGLQKIARLYGYKGALDQNFGPGSMAGFAQFLRLNWGYVGNDTLGPVMWAAIARWLRARYGYVGNDVPGPNMRAALLRADTANWAAL